LSQGRWDLWHLTADLYALPYLYVFIDRQVFLLVKLRSSSLIAASERFLKPVIPVFIIVVFFTVTNLVQMHLLPQRSVKFRE